jgi:hypothetical protein
VPGVHPCEDGLAKVCIGSRRSGGPGLLAGDRTILIGALAMRRGRWARRQSILSRRGTARVFLARPCGTGHHDNAVVHKFDLRILNGFLIEKMAFRPSCLWGSRRFLCVAGSFFGRTFQENIGKRTRRIAVAQDRVI